MCDLKHELFVSGVSVYHFRTVADREWLKLWKAKPWIRGDHAVPKEKHILKLTHHCGDLWTVSLHTELR